MLAEPRWNTVGIQSDICEGSAGLDSLGVDNSWNQRIRKRISRGKFKDPKLVSRRIPDQSLAPIIKQLPHPVSNKLAIAYSMF